MRLLFVTNSLSSGGAERVLTIIANSLSSRGFDISIYSKQINKPFYFINKEIKVFYPKKNISQRNRFESLKDRLLTYLSLYAHMSKYSYDFVISFNTFTNGPVILLAKILKIKVIACEHNNYKLQYDNIINRFIKRRLYTHADQLTVLTKRDKDLYYNKFLKNVEVLPNPLSFEIIDKSNVKKESRDKIILLVANLNRWHHKGLDKFCAILKKIDAKNLNGWKIQIAGSGDSSHVKGLIASYNLQDRIELIGEVSEMQELMKKVAVFALPSRYEGLPMVLLEAMSQGVTCIAFDCFTGPGDVLTNNIDGILVPDQDEDLFAKRLGELLINEKLRNELAVKALKTSENYGVNLITEKWISIINGLS